MSSAFLRRCCFVLYILKAIYAWIFNNHASLLMRLRVRIAIRLFFRSKARNIRNMGNASLLCSPLSPFPFSLYFG